MGNRRGATAHQVRIASDRAPSGPVPDAQPTARIPPQAARPEDGFDSGYGVKTLPGVREAIEQRNWKEAQEQIEIASTAITEYSKQVDAANKILMLR